MKSSLAIAATIYILLVSSASACGHSKHKHHHHHPSLRSHVSAPTPSHVSVPAPSPSPIEGGGDSGNCMSAVMTNMITCMDYVLQGSTEKKPDNACCNGTREVMKEEGANCLCQAFSAAPQYGIQIDVARTAALPSLCHISSDAYLSNCLGLAEAPAMAPSPKPESHHNHHRTTSVTAPAPAPATGSSTVASVSFGLMVAIALLPLAFSV